MSVRVMTRVWDLELPDSQKIVLLALADCANDEGHCWPSMRTLASKCSKGERTVQGVIIKLCEAGHLTRREVPGKGCNYTVHPRNDSTPAGIAPRREQQKPPQGLRDTPAEAADKPSKNHKQPSNTPRKRGADRPDNISQKVWSDFKSQRKKLFTDTALQGFIREADLAGWPHEEAMAYATERGWESFNAKWVEARQPATNRRRTNEELALEAERAAEKYEEVGAKSQAEEARKRAEMYRRKEAA